MTKKTDSSFTSTSEIEALRRRLREGELTSDDKKLIDKALGLLLKLISMLDQRRQSISNLKRILFGPKTDTRLTDSNEDKNDGEDSEAGTTEGVSTDSSTPESESKSEESTSTQATTEEKKERKGHGRNPASAFTGAKVVACKHTRFRIGDACPVAFCNGHLYDPKEKVSFIQLEGHPPVSATNYEREVLRCTECFERYTAELPEDVSEEKYKPSADVAIAILKHGAGMPYYRLSKLQQSFGVPLPQSVQFERCEAVADAVLPVFLRLKQLAAQAEVLFTDDTKVRILSVIKENKLLAKKERKGMYTTGIVANLSGYQIGLYISGRKHCGENVAELLLMREADLPLVIQMADALQCNWSDSEVLRIVAKCLVHARRQFIKIEKNHADQCKVVLDAIALVYKYESATKEMTPSQRLDFHQANSEPVMTKLREFIEKEFEEKRVEPNNSLGKAYDYMRNHWEGLTRWLSVIGCPLDNNSAERSLKLPVLNRKNSLFYKTEHGAMIGDILTSLIKTCELNSVEAYSYLLELVKNRTLLRSEIDDWLPWNYKKTLEGIKSDQFVTDDVEAKQLLAA